MKERERGRGGGGGRWMGEVYTGRVTYVLLVSKLCHGVKFQRLHTGFHDETLLLWTQLRISKLELVFLNSK